MPRGLVANLALLLGGLLRLSSSADARWTWGGGWLLPVGDRYELGVPARHGASPYRINRNIQEGPDPGEVHQGADIANGESGGEVRAAANGVVVLAANSGENGGYGAHVVMGHRLPDGSLVFTVYAHLIEGSLRVSAGRRVRAGQPLGRVGMTGRATSPHLHFEVRTAPDPEQRWEKDPVVDPVAFVLERVPRHHADTTWARPILEWAECAALISPLDKGASRIPSRLWWRMLAHASGTVSRPCPEDPESLRLTLVDAGLLPGKPRDPQEPPLAWWELARDLRRLRAHPTRLTYSPLARSQHRRECRERLGLTSPASHLEVLGARHGRPPSAAQACLLLADLAGPAPAPKRAPKPGPKPGRSSSAIGPPAPAPTDSSAAPDSSRRR